MTKTFRDNCDKNIVQQTSFKALSPDVQMRLKMYFFVPIVRPCNMGGEFSIGLLPRVWPVSSPAIAGPELRTDNQTFRSDYCFTCAEPCSCIYASQLWWNFRKSCMQRLRVAYNFGFRALYNLPRRTRVISHDSSGSI